VGVEIDTARAEEAKQAVEEAGEWACRKKSFTAMLDGAS